jgi:hypothetical protein
MNPLETLSAPCPYCGETIELLIDCTVESQRYIEDCQVCCRPIDMVVERRDGARLPAVTLRRQDQV